MLKLTIKKIYPLNKVGKDFDVIKLSTRLVSLVFHYENILVRKDFTDWITMSITIFIAKGTYFLI